MGRAERCPGRGIDPRRPQGGPHGWGSPGIRRRDLRHRQRLRRGWGGARPGAGLRARGQPGGSRGRYRPDPRLLAGPLRRGSGRSGSDADPERRPLHGRRRAPGGLLLHRRVRGPLHPVARRSRHGETGEPQHGGGGQAGPGGYARAAPGGSGPDRPAAGRRPSRGERGVAGPGRAAPDRRGRRGGHPGVADPDGGGGLRPPHGVRERGQPPPGASERPPARAGGTGGDGRRTGEGRAPAPGGERHPGRSGGLPGDLAGRVGLGGDRFRHARVPPDAGPPL